MTNLVQALLTEGNIDSSHCQEFGGGIYRLRSSLLVLNDLLLIILGLSGGGDHGHEVAELLTKLLLVGVFNPEEEEGFGLLGET
jgi:hypothetical protein